MRVSNTVLALALATIGSSSVIASPPQQAFTDEPSLKVPGDNPLYYCNDPSTYIGKVSYVNLSPNPPIPGQDLSIRANGTFTSEVDEGATVALTVKYNHFITLIKQTADLCENLPRIDLSCPLKEGVLGVSKDVSIPRQVPPGTYDVEADAKTKDGETITCMRASVRFGAGGH